MGRRESVTVPVPVPPPRAGFTPAAEAAASRPLRPYQHDALKYVRSRNHPALLMEMRLGKTLVVIRALRSAAQGPDGKRARFLIVAPGSALPSWEKELAAERVPADDIARLEGPRKARLAALGGSARWVLINREGWRSVPEIAECPWYAVVMDESTSIKNPAAKITRFFLRNFRRVPRRFILTGTVAPEGDHDIWTQFAFLDLPQRVMEANNFWSWRAHHFRPDPTGFGDWIPARGTATAVRSYLAERAFILSRKDAGVDVPKVYERREIEMPPAITRIYRQLEAEFVSAGGQETKSSGAVYHWARRLCGGLDEIGKEVWLGKRKELLDLLAGELAHDPVVVWFNYNDELRLIDAALSERRIPAVCLLGEMSPADRRRSANAFRDGGARVLLAQQAVAQMGADFSRADTAIYYSTPCGALARSQTEDRTTDIRRKTANLIIDLVVPGTVDEDAVDMARDKTARGAWTLERARRIAALRHVPYPGYHLPNSHETHGRGTAEHGPDNPDCPCRLTPAEPICALAGCGFCLASSYPQSVSPSAEGTGAV